MAGADFETGNVHTFPSAFNTGLDIVSGADGKFYLAHSVSGSQIDIKQWDGIQWATHSSITAAEVGADRFGPIDLIVGPDGQLHLTFQQTVGPDNDLERGIGYGNYDGNAWTLTVIEEVSHWLNGTYFYPASIAIDAEEHAHLSYAYSLPGSTRGLAYASNVSGSWESSPVSEWASTPQNGISKLSLHVDDSDVVHLIYQQSGALYHVTKSAASWDDPVDITPPPQGNGEGAFGQPFVGSDGRIYLWYQEDQYDGSWNFLSSTIYGLIHQGGSWAAETVASSSVQALVPMGLQEVDGTQYLLVQRNTAEYAPLDFQMYVRTENGSWQAGNEVDLSGYFPRAVLAVNPEGDVMVTALDGTQENIVYAFGLALGSPAAAPVVEPSLGDSAFIEGVPVVVDADLALLDEDSNTLASATVSISSGFQAGDILSAGGPFGNIIASYNPVTGVLSLTSADATATLAQWQGMLRSVTFDHSTDAPAADDRIITFQVHDGVNASIAANKTVTVTGVNDDPTGSVLISGTPLQGETLTADTSTVADPDGLGVFSYQWLADGVEILGATASTYELTQDEVGKTITVRVDYTDAQGTPETLSSTATAAVTNVNDAPTGSVTITGTPLQGETLTADTSTVADPDGLGVFSYQWLADGVEILGATTDAYVLTQAEVGKTITVRLDYTDAQGTPETLSSTATTAVANVNDDPTGSVAITGTPLQGETLTADTSTVADPDGLGVFSYQWLADGVEILGATASTYELTQAEVGKAITVRVDYTDAQGTPETLSSTATTAVANVNDDPTGSVTITGTPLQGETLTADASAVADADGLGVFSYQWLVDGVEILGATASTYELTQDEVGKAITVRVDYTDAHGTPESLSSTAAPTVININDEPTGSVAITGTPLQGETLTADTSTVADADGLGAFSYQWLADGVEILGATASTYELTQDEVGKAITVRVDYIDAHGTPETLSSTATAAVVNINDDPTGSVTITGTPLQGETLTVDTSNLADADGLGLFSYQWFADGVEIDGATQATHALTQAEVGKPITVRVTYTDGQGANESVVSTATAGVENVNDAPEGTVVITGEIDQGETLFADTSGLSDADGLETITYQWQADGVDIPGATDAHYVLTQAEVGKAISVTVRYTDGGGYAESVASTATAAIRNVNDAPTLSGLPDQPLHIPTWPATRLPEFVIDDADGPDEILTLTLAATNARVMGIDDADPVEPGIQIQGTAAELDSLLSRASVRPDGSGEIILTLTVQDEQAASASAAMAFVAQSTPPSPPPEPPLVDGVAVTVRTVTDPDAGVLREISVPVVTESRDDTDNQSALADIPLVTGSQGADLLAAHVPTGFGLTARGTPAPQPASSALEGLIAAIRAHTEAGSDVQKTMLGGGTGFLQSLDPADELLVYRLTLTAPGDAPPAQPLVISGAPAPIDAVKAALVIDASQLPVGSVIHLENVAFAVIIGAVDVAGGSGAQIVYADDSAQSLVLGEGDDILYAGGGDDTVGSAEGDDRIFGNAGDDVLFGGPGQDLLHGGSGNDTALFDADIARYAITRDHAITVVQSLDDPSDVDTLVNIETLQFADGVVSVEHDGILGTLAGLYQQVLHRQADLEGIQYWAKAHAAGMNLGDIALSFVWSDEALAQPGAADPIARAATVEVLYEQLLDRQPDAEGQAYWVDRLADGMTLSDVAISIVYSDEMQALLPGPSDWEFFV